MNWSSNHKFLFVIKIKSVIFVIIFLQKSILKAYCIIDSMLYEIINKTFFKKRGGDLNKLNNLR